MMVHDAAMCQNSELLSQTKVAMQSDANVDNTKLHESVQVRCTIVENGFGNVLFGCAMLEL